MTDRYFRRVISPIVRGRFETRREGLTPVNLHHEKLGLASVLIVAEKSAFRHGSRSLVVERALDDCVSCPWIIRKPGHHRAEPPLPTDGLCRPVGHLRAKPRAIGTREVAAASSLISAIATIKFGKTSVRQLSFSIFENVLVIVLGTRGFREIRGESRTRRRQWRGGLTRRRERGARHLAGDENRAEESDDPGRVRRQAYRRDANERVDQTGERNALEKARQFGVREPAALARLLVRDVPLELTQTVPEVLVLNEDRPVLV